MKIGVFDSGIGGRAIARSLAQAFDTAEIVVVNDSAHVPYGSRTPDDILELTRAAVQPLLNASCDVIVIACNTATAVAIDWLREHYPDQLFVGLEPMIKKAALLTETKVVTICATPATLASHRYKELKRRSGNDTTFLEPDCGVWATMIENNDINVQLIQDVVEDGLDKNSDVFVLACTHYHWIRDTIEKVVNGRALVIDPSEAIIRRIREITKEN